MNNTSGLLSTISKSTFVSVGHLIILPIILYGAILGFQGSVHKGLNFIIMGLVGFGIMIHVVKLMR